jgi:hypothetical protein
MLLTELSDRKPAGGSGINAAFPNSGYIISGFLGHKST